MNKQKARELNDEIINRQIKRIKDMYPNWEVPDKNSVYCFSINQANEMLDDMKKEILEKIDKFGYAWKWSEIEIRELKKEIEKQ
jgi:hypothetical protein